MAVEEKAEIEHVPTSPAHDGGGLVKVATTATEGDRVADEAIGGTISELPPGYYRSVSFIGTLVAFVFASFSENVGFIFVFNLLTTINQEIGPDPSYIWVSTAYSIGIAISCLIWGRLSDIFGRRWWFIGGNVVALVGSIIGATTPNVTGLIFCLALIGVAFPAQLSFTICLAELIPNKYRGHSNAALFLIATPFSVFGPVLARLLQANTAAGWRWAYYLNIILASLTCILAFFFYHPPVFEQLHTKVSKRQAMISLDYVGIFLFTAGLVLFLIGINWGGTVYPWRDAHVLGPFLVGVVALIAFVFWEIYMAKQPILPMNLLKNSPFIGMVLAAAAGSCVFYPLQILWPQQITALYTSDPAQIGLLSTAVGGGSLLGQLVAGFGTRAIGKQKYQFLITATTMTAFVAALAATSPYNQQMIVAFCLLGSISLGFVESASLTLVPFVADDKDIGLVVGVLSSARSWISAIALAIYNSIFRNKLGYFLPEMVGSVGEEAGLSSSATMQLVDGFNTGSFSDIPGLTPQILDDATTAYKLAFSKSVSVVYLASLAFGALAIGGAFLIPNLESSFNDKVARKMHGKDIDEMEAAEKKLDREA